MRTLRSLAVLVLVLKPVFAQPSHPPAKPTVCGPPANNTLQCPRFGFTYKIPFGWVDRTDELESENDSGAGNSAQQPGAKSETLLAIFERPPRARGETINSAVVIAAEPLEKYHGIKTAADYFGPITELAEQRGFKTEGDPHAFRVGAQQLIRADFSKPRGSLTMFQSSLVMLARGFVVSFTFVGGSEDEIEELAENLSFDVSQRQKQVPHR